MCDYHNKWKVHLQQHQRTEHGIESRHKYSIEVDEKHDKESSGLHIFDKLLLINMLLVICNTKKKS